MPSLFAIPTYILSNTSVSCLSFICARNTSESRTEKWKTLAAY